MSHETSTLNGETPDENEAFRGSDSVERLEGILRRQLRDIVVPGDQMKGIDPHEAALITELQERIAETGVSLPSFTKSVNSEGIVRLSFDTAAYRREYMASDGTKDTLREMGTQPGIHKAIRKRERLASSLRSLVEQYADNREVYGLYVSNQETLSALRLCRQHASYREKAGAVVRDIQDQTETNAITPHGDDWINPYKAGFPVIVYDVEYTDGDAAERYLYVSRGYTSVKRMDGPIGVAAEQGAWAFPQLDKMSGAYSLSFMRKKVARKVNALPLHYAEEEHPDAVASNNLERYVGKSLLRSLDPVDTGLLVTLTDGEKRTKGYKRSFELSAIGDLAASADGKVRTRSGKAYDIGNAPGGQLQVKTPPALSIPVRDAEGTMRTDADGKPVIAETIRQPFFDESFDRRKILSVPELPFVNKTMERLALDLQRAVSLLFNRLPALNERQQRTALRTLRVRVQKACAVATEKTREAGAVWMDPEEARGIIEIAFGTLEYELDEIERMIELPSLEPNRKESGGRAPSTNTQSAA